MTEMNELLKLKKDLRVLFASSLLFILVYIKEYSWAWFGNTIFWIISFLLILYCLFLIGWLLFNIYRWGKGGFKEIYSLGIYLITTGILLISIYGMR
jgi:hypothetical protein